MRRSPKRGSSAECLHRVVPPVALTRPQLAPGWPISPQSDWASPAASSSPILQFGLARGAPHQGTASDEGRGAHHSKTVGIAKGTPREGSGLEVQAETQGEDAGDGPEGQRSSYETGSATGRTSPSGSVPQAGSLSPSLSQLLLASASNSSSAASLPVAAAEPSLASHHNGAPALAEASGSGKMEERESYFNSFNMPEHAEPATEASVSLLPIMIRGGAEAPCDAMLIGSHTLDVLEGSDDDLGQGLAGQQLKDAQANAEVKEGEQYAAEDRKTEQQGENGEESDDDERALHMTAWHEVEAMPLSDPVTGRPLMLLLQTDVTARSRLERNMAALTETQLSMLEQVSGGKEA